jgi:hypothetical protein
MRFLFLTIALSTGRALVRLIAVKHERTNAHQQPNS